MTRLGPSPRSWMVVPHAPRLLVGRLIHQVEVGLARLHHVLDDGVVALELNDDAPNHDFELPRRDSSIANGNLGLEAHRSVLGVVRRLDVLRLQRNLCEGREQRALELAVYREERGRGGNREVLAIALRLANETDLLLAIRIDVAIGAVVQHEGRIFVLPHLGGKIEGLAVLEQFFEGDRHMVSDSCGYVNESLWRFRSDRAGRRVRRRMLLAGGSVHASGRPARPRQIGYWLPARVHATATCCPCRGNARGSVAWACR